MAHISVNTVLMKSLSRPVWYKKWICRSPTFDVAMGIKFQWEESAAFLESEGVFVSFVLYSYSHFLSWKSKDTSKSQQLDTTSINERALSCG